MNIKLFLAVLFVSLSSTIFSQTIKKVDGLYVSENGKPYSGLYVTYHPNKQKEAVYSLKNGLEDGSVEFYYSSSEIMEQGGFKKGKKDGKWVRWSVDGSKLAEAQYLSGVKEGKWTIWDERGVKRYEMFYSNGEKTGTWKMWDEKGQISNIKDY